MQFPLIAMESKPINILLADDDIDDCIFFKDILAVLPTPTKLTVVHDGNQLMQLLTRPQYILPHVLFLDLNMPRKNGFECLLAIKANKSLEVLPVIMYSTSSEQEVVNQLYRTGAQYFIRKPANISLFKEIIQQTLNLIGQRKISQTTREDFVIMV